MWSGEGTEGLSLGAVLTFMFPSCHVLSYSSMTGVRLVGWVGVAKLANVLFTWIETK